MRHPSFERIRIVMSDPMNQLLPRDEFSGKLVEEDWVKMHNGILVKRDSYYGGREHGHYFDVVLANRGVHEPQEEVVFSRILPMLSWHHPTMLELGSGWSYYSAWFMKANPKGKVWLVDCDEQNLKFGKETFAKNFGTNGLSGSRAEFIRAKVGEDFEVDSFISRNHPLGFSVLHADIQGHELEMLLGAKNSLQAHRFCHVLVSTHTPTLHTECRSFLSEVGYNICVDVPMESSFAYDGFICATSYPSWKDWKLDADLSDRRITPLIPEEQVEAALINLPKL